MIPQETAQLRDALIAVGTTNSEDQALQWAHKIIEYLNARDIVICPEDWLAG